jgi:hypothetical protein
MVLGPIEAIGPIEAVRVFTIQLAQARRFYAETLGLQETVATDAVAIFDTGQARLIVEQVAAADPEASELVGRFTGFSFTVKNMESTLNALGVDPSNGSVKPSVNNGAGCCRTSKTPTATFSRSSNTREDANRATKVTACDGTLRPHVRGNSRISTVPPASKWGFPAKKDFA